ncbi:MAG: FkbM family methyltransferase [Acidimicrobiia bacterium]|jgi:FkbM family methyltransferase
MPTDLERPLRWLKRLVVGTGQAPRLASLLERAGALRLADRVSPPAPSVVTVELPRGGRGPVRRIRMSSLEGRDQVARGLRDAGWDGFEPPLPTVVTRAVRRWPGTVFDVGANTGLYSLIATAAHDRATAVAFEPVPEIVVLLRSNLALNPGGSRVIVEEVAIGDATGRATLHLPPAQPDGTIETSASLEPDFKEQIDRVIEVATSTLDDAWRRHGRPEVTMVKIDVEGSEARVLAGAGDLVAACRPIVSVEVLDRVDPAPLEALREELGYLDVSLAPDEACVHTAVEVIPGAANHLLVPRERLDAVVADLRQIPGLRVRHDA